MGVSDINKELSDVSKDSNKSKTKSPMISKKTTDNAENVISDVNIELSDVTKDSNKSKDPSEESSFTAIKENILLATSESDISENIKDLKQLENLRSGLRKSNTSDETSVSAESITPPKRRRGRPPKNQALINPPVKTPTKKETKTSVSLPTKKTKVVKEKSPPRFSVSLPTKKTKVVKEKSPPRIGLRTLRSSTKRQQFWSLEKPPKRRKTLAELALIS